MKKIILYITASIDGYISYPDGDLEWLKDFQIPLKEDYGYKEFIKTIDTLIMGGKVYREILSMDVIWPHQNISTFVITHHNKQYKHPNVEFISDNIIESVLELKKGSGGNIWLVGGGELTSLFLNHDLIDRMIINYIPMILGNGIPLFPKISKESKWHLNNISSLKNSITSADYQLVKD